MNERDKRTPDEQCCCAYGFARAPEMPDAPCVDCPKHGHAATNYWCRRHAIAHRPKPLTEDQFVEMNEA